MDNSLNYGDLLLTPTWRIKRQEVLKRDNYCCKECGKKPTKLYFLNFNYTNTLQPYLSCLNDNELHELNHIQGSLYTNHGLPIFGYADDLNENFKAFEELKINELYDNIKTFAYNDEANYANLMRILNEVDYQVTIYGHSCGLSDRTLLNRIFEHDNCKSIKTLLNDRLVNKKDSEPMVQPEKVIPVNDTAD